MGNPSCCPRRHPHGPQGKRDGSDIDKLGNLVHQRAFLRLKAVLGSTHFPRATTGTKGRLQAQSFGDLLLPLWLAERAASLHALAERLQFLVVVRLIDPLDPIRGPIDRPRRQQGPVLRGAVTLSPQTRPSPFLRSKNELSALRIALRGIRGQALFRGTRGTGLGLMRRSTRCTGITKRPRWRLALR